MLHFSRSLFSDYRLAIQADIESQGAVGGAAGGLPAPAVDNDVINKLPYMGKGKKHFSTNLKNCSFLRAQSHWFSLTFGDPLTLWYCMKLVSTNVKFIPRDFGFLSDTHLLCENGKIFYSWIVLLVSCL